MTLLGVEKRISNYDLFSSCSTSSYNLCPPHSIELNRIRYTVFIVRCDALLNLLSMYIVFFQCAGMGNDDFHRLFDQV